MLYIRDTLSKERRDFMLNYQIESLPICALATKESKKRYKELERIVSDFDRNFDNTVVDTYAFDKALNTDQLCNGVYYFLYETDDPSNTDFSSLSKLITDYILRFVQGIYERTNHHLVKANIYHDYVNSMLKRLPK